MRHAALVLAAGGSRRLGRPKQLVPWEGEALVRRAVRLALGTGAEPCVVVVGARAGEVAEAAGAGIVRVDCARWELGMGESLACGLEALGCEADAALVMACDQPRLDAAHLQRLLGAWRASPRRAAASAYAGVAGVPAVLPRAWWPEVRRVAVGSDRGAREVFRSRMAEVTLVEAPELGHDVDVPEDLED